MQKQKYVIGWHLFTHVIFLVLHHKDVWLRYKVSEILLPYLFAPRPVFNLVCVYCSGYSVWA